MCSLIFESYQHSNHEDSVNFPLWWWWLERESQDVPSRESREVFIFSLTHSVANPSAGDVEIVTETTQDGGEESVLFHTIAAQAAVDKFIEQRLRVE